MGLPCVVQVHVVDAALDVKAGPIRLVVPQQQLTESTASVSLFEPYSSKSFV